MLSFQEAYDTLFSMDRFRKHFGLSDLALLLHLLGNPHRAFKVIQIGGTNGKGSTASMIGSILHSAGYRVGLFTSPHLDDFTERIRVDGVRIDRDEVCDLVERLFSSEIDISRRPVARPVTFFEALTTMAFVHFASRRVDFAVLEVGIEGRLDATNITNAMISVITNVTLDHIDFFGTDVDEIARRKGGIIKRDGICLSGSQSPSVIRVLEGICRRKRVPFYLAGRDFRTVNGRNGTFHYLGRRNRYTDLELALGGGHQLANATCALGAIECVEGSGFPVGAEAVRAGMAGVRWKGRLELVAETPRVVLDGAHNPAGARALRRALHEVYTWERLILVIGMLEGKDCAGFLSVLCRDAAAVILCRPDSERAVEPHDLAVEAGRWCTRIEVVPPAMRALALASTVASRGDLVCVTGSLYLMAEARKASEDGGR